MNTVRVFGFATQEGVDFQMLDGLHNQTVLHGLDLAVALAGQRGLKLIIALANNWDYTGSNIDTKCVTTPRPRL